MITEKNLGWGGICLYAFAYITALFLFTTCLSVDENFLQSKLTISDDNQTEFEKDGGTRIFEIESNRDWSVKVESGAEWIAVSPMKGSKETKELTVTVKNNDGEARKGSIKVTCSSIDKIITVAQKGKDAPTLEYTSIRDIRDMYEACEENELIIDEPLMLKAVVISDRVGANRSAKRDGFIQDDAGDGLAFRVTQPENLYDLGDELVINLKDARIHYFDYAGIVQILFSKMGVELINQNVFVAPKELTISEINDRKYDGTLVKIKDVQFREYEELRYYDSGSSTSRLLECADGSVIDVKTTKNADFRNEALPIGSGNIVGIASFCKESWELQIRNLDDVKEMSNDVSTRFEQKEPPVESTKITIADLRTKLKNVETYTEENYIEGEVILNAYKRNVPDNVVYIADETAGIVLAFSDSKNVLTNLPIGAKVKVRLKGLKAKETNGLLQIGEDNTLTTQAVTIIEEESSAPLEPKDVTIDDLLSGKYQSELVRIENVQFKEIGIIYADSPSIVNHAGKEVHVCTREEADFSEDVVKEGMGTFVAVVSVSNIAQMIIRSIDDLTDMTDRRFDTTSSFIIPSKDKIFFEGYGGIESMAITANVNWYVLSDEAWLSVAPSSGANDGVITITASRNEGEERKATIVITDGTIAKTVEVIQKSTDEISKPAADLFFSEYVEGSSYNKYLEIYNGTGKAVDLSDYMVEVYVNGQSVAKYKQELEGVLNSGEVIVLANPKATIYNGDTFESNALNFNGNDAVALVKISTDDYVDIFGRIGEDPGSGGWLGSLAEYIITKDRTLVRKPSVRGGVTKNPKRGFPTLKFEWIVYPKDTSDYLGSHTMD